MYKVELEVIIKCYSFLNDDKCDQQMYSTVSVVIWHVYNAVKYTQSHCRWWHISKATFVAAFC